MLEGAGARLLVVEEFIALAPENADEIRELLPSLILLEQVGPDEQGARRPGTGRPPIRLEGETSHPPSDETVLSVIRIARLPIRLRTIR
jgi:hypothetical protein